MTTVFLEGLNHGNKIGVLLGTASQGLCTIDADTAEGLETLLEANRAFREALMSHGARGWKVWLRIRGAFPNQPRSPLQMGPLSASGGPMETKPSFTANTQAEAIIPNSEV